MQEYVGVVYFHGVRDISGLANTVGCYRFMAYNIAAPRTGAVRNSRRRRVCYNFTLGLGAWALCPLHPLGRGLARRRLDARTFRPKMYDLSNASVWGHGQFGGQFVAFSIPPCSPNRNRPAYAHERAHTAEC